ncbi:hypothetical protein BC936DRAFT_142743 [Jimgerdemannia flammicorona]|uniref:Transmembrane protein n=1 Tax=Jimgerdemannia flammicorona TaxID=994334 RepID=A0A433DEV7_9FUNG|nr:hypothetical protein BC936DRAFT_142743 [Jimgerdemannia flammicorona]
MAENSQYFARFPFADHFSYRAWSQEANMANVSYSAVSLIEKDGVYHCDWRLVIDGCVESNVMHMFYTIDVAFSALLVIAVLFELAWIFGYQGLVLYAIGIVTTLPENSSFSRSWRPTPFQIDAMGIWLLSGPGIVNSICAIVSGHLADIGQDYLAVIFIRLTYALWVSYDVCLACAVMHFGMKLTNTLERHLGRMKSLQIQSKRSGKMETEIVKIRVIIVCGVVCVSAFATLLLLYCILRTEIHTTPIVSAPPESFVAELDQSTSIPMSKVSSTYQDSGEGAHTAQTEKSKLPDTHSLQNLTDTYEDYHASAHSISSVASEPHAYSGKPGLP